VNDLGVFLVGLVGQRSFRASFNRPELAATEEAAMCSNWRA
jgi:hypothetical protein